MEDLPKLSARIIKCPTCNTSLKLTDSERVIGQTVNCPRCKNAFINRIQTLNITFKNIAIGMGILVLFCIIGGINNENRYNQETSKFTEHEDNLQTLPTTLSPSLKISSTSPSPTPSDTSIVPTQTAMITSTPKPTTRPTTRTTPKPTVKPQSQYSCNCSKTCTQIKTCAEAQYQLNQCGCKQRDADHDGTACDAAPLHCQN